MHDVTIARDFLNQHLPPALLARMDLSTLEVRPETFINDALKASACDVLYVVKMDGQSAYIYLLIEHQREMRLYMPVDVFGYKHDIWMAHIKHYPGTKLPVIIPIIFYNGETPYTASTQLKDFMAGPMEFIEEHLHQDFILIDVHNLEDETLREQKWAGMLAFFMKHVNAPDIVKYVREVIGSLITLIGLGYEGFVVSLLNYYMSEAKGFNLTIYIELVQEYFSKEIGAQVMNMAQQLRNEGIVIGIKQGVQQGIEQGIEQGEAIVLLHLLQRKFGKVPAHHRAKIEAADSELLLSLAEGVLEASSLDGLFNKIATP